MTVYVDDMYKYRMGQYGRMKMSHMVADGGEQELIRFATRIGMDVRHIQHRGQGRGRVHFDISKSMRSKAVKEGAEEITLRELAVMCAKWNAENARRRQAGLGTL